MPGGQASVPASVHATSFVNLVEITNIHTAIIIFAQNESKCRVETVSHLNDGLLARLRQRPDNVHLLEAKQKGKQRNETKKVYSNAHARIGILQLDQQILTRLGTVDKESKEHEEGDQRHETGCG